MVSTEATSLVQSIFDRTYSIEPTAASTFLVSAAESGAEPAFFGRCLPFGADRVFEVRLDQGGFVRPILYLVQPISEETRMIG